MESELSKKFVVSALSVDRYNLLLNFIRKYLGSVQNPHRKMLEAGVPTVDNRFPFYQSVLLNRRRYTSTSTGTSKRESPSLIQARFRTGGGESWTWCGVLEDIMVFQYIGVDHPVAYVQWFAQWNGALPRVWNT